jgi:DUF1365 family protein
MREFESCIYEGTVSHRRFSPRPHEFHYSLFMMYLDLAELRDLFEGRWFWSAQRRALARFRREDYLPSEPGDLDEAVRNVAAREIGRRPVGPIRLLTHLRYFGHQFNPLSIFFCLDESAAHTDAIVAEVSNTPWGERHIYVLDTRRNEGRQGTSTRYRFSKSFHVSPFMPMGLEYRWSIGDPAHYFNLHAESFGPEGKLFDATLLLERREITPRSLASVLLRFPWMTGKVVAAIYFQALRLWLKRIPFYPHPDKLPQAMEAGKS